MSDPTRDKFARGPFLRFNPRAPFSFDLPQDPLVRRDVVRDQLRLGPRANALQSKPARDLTQEEARDLTAYYALTGQITLEKPVTFQMDGRPAFPKPNEKVALGLTIAGVSFVPNNPDAAAWQATKPLDMRLVVLLVRLSQYLNTSKWGVTVIYWGGLGIAGQDPQDRHGKGFALDFHGAFTRRGRFEVLRDWWNRPITLPNGKPAPHNQWPSNVQPYFRLDVDDPTGAGGFFYDVYHFLTGEAADGFNPAHPTSIGDHSYILHPDHPDPNQRYPHRDHIHAEIGR
jgi:hypothetical protein